jgi:mono/diheme cytochrome c family protein
LPRTALVADTASPEAVYDARSACGKAPQKLLAAVAIWQSAVPKNAFTASNRSRGMQMKWTMMAAAALAAWLSAPLAKAVAEPIELQWWHAMTAVNADRVNKIAADFNASQDTYKLIPVFKGSYAER